MKVINPGFEILRPFTWDDGAGREAIYRMIETAGRTCYKSEKKTTAESAARFVQKIVENHHEAMLEHASMTVKFIVDRGVSHEIVRHRLFSFAQESTRYCNYSGERFGEEITVIKPFFYPADTYAGKVWYESCLHAEKAYMLLIRNGSSPQEARSVLPNSLKTELVVTGNMREWRHFFKLRAAGETGKPHPQMAEVAVPLLMMVQNYMPELFGDIKIPGGNGE